MGTIGSAILEALVNLEKALEDALTHSADASSAKLSDPVKEAMAALETGEQLA